MAISAIAAKYQKYFITVSYNILQNSQDAEECVNDAYLKTWDSIPPSKPSRLAAFTGKITRNISIDCYKRKHADKRGKGIVDIALSELEECISAESDVEADIERELLYEKINDFLGGLPKRQRMIFVCRYWYLNRISEIANDFGISESNVKTILFKIRRKLGEYLKQEGIGL